MRVYHKLLKTVGHKPPPQINFEYRMHVYLEHGIVRTSCISYCARTSRKCQKPSCTLLLLCLLTLVKFDRCKSETGEDFLVYGELVFIMSSEHDEIPINRRR